MLQISSSRRFSLGQVSGFDLYSAGDGDEGPGAPLVNVEIVSKRRGQRYDALRITSEELFAKPNKFSIVFGFDSEKLKSPMQLEADVEVRNAGTPIIARINSPAQ